MLGTFTMANRIKLGYDKQLRGELVRWRLDLHYILFLEWSWHLLVPVVGRKREMNTSRVDSYYKIIDSEVIAIPITAHIVAYCPSILTIWFIPVSNLTKIVILVHLSKDNPRLLQWSIIVSQRFKPHLGSSSYTHLLVSKYHSCEKILARVMIIISETLQMCWNLKFGIIGQWSRPIVSASLANPLHLTLFIFWPLHFLHTLKSRR